MNLSTTYLGLQLRTPLITSASTLTQDFDNIKRLENAGAAAIVLHSLFEEQIRLDQLELDHHLVHGTESYSEALNYFPQPETEVGPEEYLRLISRAKKAVKIPIIASLNGSTSGGWTNYASKMEEAGADALELNIYSIATDPDLDSLAIEQNYLDIVRAVKSVVTIPVAVKLSPFFTNFSRMARQLNEAGADGLVLFNRFYQPDIDVENLDVGPNLLLSTPMAMRLPLTWVALLAGRIPGSLAATSGIHRATDALKMIMAGADVTMLCSILLRRGIGHLRVIEREMTQWLEDHQYDSLEQLKGCLSQQKCPHPSAFERAQYLQSISTYVEH